MPSPQTVCEERIRLSEEVADAVLRKHKARKAYDRAVEAKQDIGALLQALNEARTAERVLVSKLAQHRKEHGCYKLAQTTSATDAFERRG
jgi:hypothetical protein